MNLIDAARLTEAELDAVDSEILFDGESMRPIADLQLAKALWTVVDAWAARSDTRVAGELRNMLAEAGVERPEERRSE